MQIIFILAILFIAVSIFILFIYPAAESYKIFHLGIPVNAFIYDRKEKIEKGQKFVKFIWKYSYEEKERLYRSTYWQREDERNIGYKGVLLLDKRNTDFVFEFLPDHYKSTLRKTGTMLMIIGIILILIFLNIRSMTISLSVG